MFWLRGEKLGEEVTADDLSRWIALPAEKIRPVLQEMADSNLIDPAPVPGSFRLTQMGVTEGGRRFADEFADMTRPGHGECSDPNCDCRTGGDPAECVHQH
jgi:hypothetical protein